MILNLWCIHGNLQNPSVWDFLDTYKNELMSSISAENYRINIIKVNLWNDIANSMEEWALRFCNQVENLKPQSKNIVLGYSLGGRLAMQALVTNPELWSVAIIVSAHPGLKSDQEKLNSFDFDLKWSNKFQNESWEELIDEWDSLPVFCGFNRQITIIEKLFDRDAIGELFKVYSKGHQDYLPDKLKKILNMKMLYIAGEMDVKYTNIGMALSDEIHNLKFCCVKNAGHRVPWENQPVFFKKIFDFISDQL